MVEGPRRVSPTSDDIANNETGFRFVRALAVEKAALDRRLTLADIRVLAAISYFMSGKHKRAWPSYSSLAEIADVSVVSVRRAITSLKVNGYIFTNRHASIRGGRAITHYGLKGIHPADIDAMISDAVRSLKASAMMQTNNGPTASSDMQSEADCLKSSRPDCIKRSHQEPYVEEPSDRKFVDERARGGETDVFTDDELAELHALCNGWGQKTQSSWFKEVDRAACDRMIADEINACRSRNAGVDEGSLRSAALVTLNTLRLTEPKGSNGGCSMLKLFRSIIDSELARTPRAAPAGRSRPQRLGPTSTAELARAAFAPRES